MAYGNNRGGGGNRTYPDREALDNLRRNMDDVLNFSESPNLAGVISDLKVYIKGAGRDIKTHQLRNIYSKVREADTVLKLQLLRPKLAYVAARQGKPGARFMVEYFDTIIEKVESDKQVQSFHAFFEAVVAYHKFYHG